MTKKNLRYSTIMLIIITYVGCVACCLTACKNSSDSSIKNAKAEEDKKTEV